MNKLNLFLACSLLLAPTYLFSFSDSLVVFFKTDEYILEDAQQKALKNYCSSIDFNEDFRLLIKGFADHRGTNNYNKVLAENRAKTVRDYLLKNDILEREVELVSLGEDQSYLTGMDDQILAPDRKVVVYYETRRYSSLDEFMEGLVDNDHRFQLSPKKKNTIDLPSGARIIMESSCLTDKDGNLINEDFELHVTEAMNFTQMVSEDLSTECDGKMIETGGMFDIRAYDKNGDELFLDPEKPMQLLIPTIEPQSDMELFSSDDGGDWTPVGQTSRVFPEAKQAAPKIPVQKLYGNPEIVRKEYQIDHKGRPFRPVYLTAPKPPIEPQRSDFEYKVEWYRFPWRNKHERRMERAYESAMKHYDRADRKYEKRLAYYQQNNKTYSDRLNSYEAKFAVWEEREGRNAEEFYIRQREEISQKYQAFRERALQLGQAEYEAAMEVYRKELEEYRKWREEQMAALDLHNMNSIDEVSAYAFSLTNFGWVNCDRFPEIGLSRGEILVESTPTEPGQERIVAIFDSIRALMNFQTVSEDEYVLSEIPMGTTATILAFKVEDGKVYMAKQDTRPGNKIELEYKLSNYREVASVLAKQEI